MTYPTKKIGEICDIIGGGTPSTIVKKYWDGDIEMGNTTKKITQMGLNELSATLKVRALQTLQSTQAADLKALKQSVLYEAFLSA